MTFEISNLDVSDIQLDSTTNPTDKQESKEISKAQIFEYEEIFDK